MVRTPSVSLVECESRRCPGWRLTFASHIAFFFSRSHRQRGSFHSREGTGAITFSTQPLVKGLTKLMIDGLSAMIERADVH